MAYQATVCMSLFLIENITVSAVGGIQNTMEILRGLLQTWSMMLLEVCISCVLDVSINFRSSCICCDVSKCSKNIYDYMS